MKRKSGLLYIPLILLFVFAMAVIITHFSKSTQNFAQATVDYQIPFRWDGPVSVVKDQAYAEGLRNGDKIVGLNGVQPITNEFARQELPKSTAGAPLNLVVERQTADGGTETLTLIIHPTKVEKNVQFYMKLATAFVFLYILPTFCILLGFWVAFIRVRDPLAWILLFMMMGIAGIGLEGYTRGQLVNSYQQIFTSAWPLSMLLFGIYFPERLKLDIRRPWLKYILVVPLGFQIVATLLEQLKVYTGFAISDLLDPITNVYGSGPAALLNTVAIGLFFAALGYKSGTLENKDARRRLRLMVIGTTVAMTPAFLIIVISMITRTSGSFYDRAPWWIALIGLLGIILFPITMAYVIVVQRAMNVSVVIRQGLQYALASNGVKVLQFVFLVCIIFLMVWTFRNFSENTWAQVGFIAAGFAFIPLIEFGAKRLRTWVDRRFFREVYNSEQILAELSDNVRTMVETRPLLETVSNKIAESMHVPQVALLLRNGTSFEPAYALGYDSAPVISLSENMATIEKLKKNEPIMFYEDDKDDLSDDETGEREMLRELNSQLLLPVGAKDELSGVISLSPKRSEEPYSPNDLRLLRSVAMQTGLALENSRLTEAIAAEVGLKERLNRELEIAREVQERLFPQDLPDVEGLEYYGACRPALGVGGDYYDFFELETGKFGIAIGDVSGKGIGASLMMASLQASLRGQAIHANDDLAGLMGRVNKLVYDTSTTNRYATFFHAQYDSKTRNLLYVNAGHNPPYIIRGSGPEQQVIELTDGGAVVGMLPPILVNYSQGAVKLQQGDLLVGFTDGISEAMNPNEEEWGEEAVLEEMKKLVDMPCKEILEHIVAAADKFADGAKQHDDMTMIVLRVF